MQTNSGNPYSEAHTDAIANNNEHQEKTVRKAPTYPHSFVCSECGGSLSQLTQTGPSVLRWTCRRPGCGWGQELRFVLGDPSTGREFLRMGGAR